MFRSQRNAEGGEGARWVSSGRFALSGTIHALRVSYRDPEVFSREYASNLSKGGIFVATAEILEINTPVRVQVVLDYCDFECMLEGEVVGCVGPDLEAVGGVAGVAVALLSSVSEIHEIFGAHLLVPRANEAGEQGDERRRTPRSTAHIEAQIRSRMGDLFRGATRNISRGGVLVNVRGSALALGEDVHVTLFGESGGQEGDQTCVQRTIPAVVARHVCDEHGEICAVGLHFLPEPDEADVVAAFIDGIKAKEHVRRLGAISGSLEAMGLAELIQGFGLTSPEGAFTLTCGADEGRIRFRGRMIIEAKLGPVSGLKAMTRMMSWREGEFEFEPSAGTRPGDAEVIPIEVALMESVRLIDELDHGAAPAIDPRARFSVDVNVAACIEGALCKVDRAILDLATVSMPLHRILDTIPEPDPQILKHVASLLDQGALIVDEDGG